METHQATQAGQLRFTRAPGSRGATGAQRHLVSAAESRTRTPTGAGSRFVPRIPTAQGIPEPVLASRWVKQALSGLQRGGRGGRGERKGTGCFSFTRYAHCSHNQAAPTPTPAGSLSSHPGGYASLQLPRKASGHPGRLVWHLSALARCLLELPWPSGKAPGPAPQVTALVISPLPPALESLLSFLPIWQLQAPQLTVDPPTDPPPPTPQTEVLGAP